MPLLVLLLLGVVDFGWWAYQYVELANAANAGVHYAAQNVVAAAQTSAIQAAMNSDAANVNPISPTVSMACTCSDSTLKNSDGTKPSCTTYDGCKAPARLIDTVTVTATKTVGPIVKWPGIPNSVTLHSSAVMQVEQ
jgi:Flp pilus assembly protein TadG